MEKSLNPLRDIVRQLAVGRNCSADCNYYMLEEGNPMLPVSGDVEIFGAPYWESCKLERALMDALEKQTELNSRIIEYQNRIKDLISTIEGICKNSRDRHVDDEHCGLCEYVGAYMGVSGDWYNECPGFDKDDCFELSEEFKKKYIDWEEE